MKRLFICLALLLFVFGLSSENEAKQKGSIPLEVVLQQGKGYKMNGARIGNQFFYAEDDRSRKADYYPLNQLLAYNLKTKRTELIYKVTEKSVGISGLIANKRWLVWTERADMGASGRLRAMDSKTKDVITIVTQQGQGLLTKAVSQNYVAFVDPPYEDQMTLSLWSFATKDIVKQVKLAPGLSTSFIALTDEELVWAEVVNGKGELVVYNIETKQTKRLSDEKTFPVYPEIGTNYYYSYNFPDERMMSWSSIVMTAWNRDTNRAETIDFPGFNEAEGFRILVAHGKYVAFLDYQGKGGLYVYKHDRQLKRIPLTLLAKNGAPNQVCFDAQGNLFIAQETEGKDGQVRTTLSFVRAEVLAKY